MNIVIIVSILIIIYIVLRINSNIMIVSSNQIKINKKLQEIEKQIKSQL